MRRPGGTNISSFSYDKNKADVLYKAKYIAARERRGVSDLIMELLEEYVKHHDQGNPNYEIKQWIGNPELRAVPAFFASRRVWREYLKTEKNRGEVTKIEQQAIDIKELARARWAERE